MQPGQKEKLEKLINSSPILDSKERVEWWGLLDLMNDKQLAELEKILNGANTASKPAPVQATQPIASKPVMPQAPAVPKLAHILNMPRVGGEASVKAGTAQSLSKDNAQFNEKLKSLLAEKELPAPQPIKEIKPPASDEKKNVKIEAHTLEVISKRPIKDDLPKVPIPHKIQQVIKPNVGISQSSQGSVLSSAAKPLGQIKPVAKTPTALNLSQEFAEKIKESNKTNSGATSKISKAPLVLETLQDLSTLKESVVEENELNTLLSKLKNLIEKYGYYQVVFNLESSPVYKTYINTGLKALDSDADLDKAEKGLENQLSRDAFEKIADLLTKIQSE